MPQPIDLRNPATWRNLPVRTRQLEQGEFGLRCRICDEPIMRGEKYIRHGNYCAHEACAAKLEPKVAN